MLKINDTTWKQEIKLDKKDELSCVIGDDKELDFKPQMKIERFSNECNVSIRLIEDKDELKETATIIEENGKIKHIKSKRECHFYDLPVSEEHSEGASEFEVILKSDPRKNKGEDYTLEFSLVDKDVDYFYQPALTPEEIAEGSSRPENVVGSYAIYAKTPKTNWTGGKEYKCGKIGHIFRPKIIDSAGTEVWGDLHIENGILSVTIPQDFLDKAVYPVRHAAGLTFGYTGAGASNTTFGWKEIDNSCDSYRDGNAYAGVDGTITEIAISVLTSMASATNGATTFYINRKDSGGSGSHGLTGSGGATIAYQTTKDWRSKTGLSIAITSGNTYIVNASVNATNLTTNKVFQIGYDTATGQSFYSEDFWMNNTHTATEVYNASKENPWTKAQNGTTQQYSIYATYTAGGGGTVVKDIIQSGIIAFPR